MNSMVGSHDPDHIDAQSSAAHRTIMKLEKTFHEPAVRKLSEIVRLTIEEFKEHMPVIMTLGNPGMKTRHWEKISEIVGFPIKVDINTTLSKV
jgi:dynein heavy chain